MLNSDQMCLEPVRLPDDSSLSPTSPSSFARVSSRYCSILYNTMFPIHIHYPSVCLHPGLSLRKVKCTINIRSSHSGLNCIFSANDRIEGN